MRFQPDAVEYRTVITGGTIDLKLSLPLQRRLERDDRSIVCLSRTDLDLRLITRFSFQLTATHQLRSCTIKSNNQPHSQAEANQTRPEVRNRTERRYLTNQTEPEIKLLGPDRFCFLFPCCFFFLRAQNGEVANFGKGWSCSHRPHCIFGRVVRWEVGAGAAEYRKEHLPNPWRSQSGYQ